MNNYSVDREKWASMDILNQMGNIGSEVGRAINAERAKDNERRDGAIYRALDLFDATVEILVQQKSPRTKEVLRARDQFLALFYDNNFDDADRINSYFMQFAIAARSHR